MLGMFSFKSINKAHAVILFGVLLATNLLGENPAGLKGRVVDQVEHAPIRNVYILVHRNGSTDKAVRTDESGRYSIELLPNLYDVFISADGFAPMCRKVEITPDGMMNFDPVLSASNIGMQQ
jgi:hypothetical protein